MELRKKEIIIEENKGIFSIIWKNISSEKDLIKKVSSLKSILTDEKAKLLYFVRTKKPNSLYQLAKELKRDFKSVSNDAKVLEKFGLIELKSEKTKKRKRFVPKILIDELVIHIKI